MKNTCTYTQRFAEDMYKSMGVRFLFFIAMETPTENINTGVLDFNDSLGGGASYVDKNPRWKTEGIDIDSWNNHNRDYYNTDTPADVMTKKVPRALLALRKNEYGEPILVNPLSAPKRQNARTWRQQLLRAFLSYHYGMCGLVNVYRMEMFKFTFYSTCLWILKGDSMEETNSSNSGLC